MDAIKEAFSKIKEDILLLKNELDLLKSSIDSMNSKLIGLNIPTNPTNIQTIPVIPTDIQAPTPTVPQEIGGLNGPNNYLSTGNRGVPTDNSTYNQSVQQTIKQTHFPSISTSINIQETLENLDSIKKDIRLKFKKLTPQEMVVFSTLYSLETQGFQEITYKIIANNLNLSESSIRDYFNKILHKGIPVVKARLNNKKIILAISPDLKKIASLATISRLRDI